MTILHCAACGLRLTDPLSPLPAVPERPSYDGLPVDGVRRAPSTVPRGHYAVDPDPTGAPFVPAEDQDDCVPAYPGGPSIVEDGVELVAGGPRDTLLLHPEDMPSLVPHPTGESGCCGLPGNRGPNRACPCGARIGTEMSECWTPYELHLVPGAVTETQGA
jgi:hypothetical protein